MRILFDNGVPRSLAKYLTDKHIIEEARARGWDTLGNGEVLGAADNAGFETLLTTDKNLRYQQNLTGRKIALVVLGQGRWKAIRMHPARVISAVDAATPNSYSEVDIPDI